MQSQLRSVKYLYMLSPCIYKWLPLKNPNLCISTSIYTLYAPLPPAPMHDHVARCDDARCMMQCDAGCVMHDAW